MSIMQSVPANTSNSLSLSALSMNPAVVALEGAHLVGVLNILMWQTWLRALAEGTALSHDMILAGIGLHPTQHVAPWDHLARTGGNGWFEAMDKVLQAMGDVD